MIGIGTMAPRLESDCVNRAIDFGNAQYLLNLFTQIGMFGKIDRLETHGAAKKFVIDPNGMVPKAA